MVYYKQLRPTRHYMDHHEHEVPWAEVYRVINETKNPKKSGNKFEIKADGYYILYVVINKTAYVINAKRT